jgi:hypothetical protein
VIDIEAGRIDTSWCSFHGALYTFFLAEISLSIFMLMNPALSLLIDSQ